MRSITSSLTLLSPNEMKLETLLTSLLLQHCRDPSTQTFPGHQVQPLKIINIRSLGRLVFQGDFFKNFFFKHFLASFPYDHHDHKTESTILCIVYGFPLLFLLRLKLLLSLDQFSVFPIMTKSLKFRKNYSLPLIIAPWHLSFHPCPWSLPLCPWSLPPSPSHCLHAIRNVPV